ncbi:MAG TPA: quinone oxidoreductase [Bacillota bacterium]
MQAIVITRYGGPEVLELQEVPQPTPGEGEVLIRTEAVGVNFADIMLRKGRYHAGGKPPVIPGLDLAGTIVAVGPGVRGLEVGQRVAAFAGAGSYAEYAVAPAVLTWPVPVGIDIETAAAFPTVGITAYNLLTLAGRLEPGETVLVHAAAGGVGTTAVQLARLLGAGTVIGTVGDDAKVPLARELGCNHVINYRREDFAARVLELTGGRGADLILDAVAGPVFAASLTCLAPFGRLVVYGMASGEPGRVESPQLHPPSRAVIGYSSGTYRRLRPEALRPAAEAVLAYLRQGLVRFVIGARFPLEQAAQAHELVESRQSTGKVLLLPGRQG